jgi:rhamnose transport system substrate-binding protein
MPAHVSRAAVAGTKRANVDIVMIPKNTADPFFSAISHGMTLAAEAAHGGYQYYGTAEPSVPGQVALIRSVAAKSGVSAITISANDPAAPVPALDAAKARGIKIVGYDADVQRQARTVFVEDAPTPAFAGGQLTLLAQELHYRGTFAIISAEPTASNQNLWIAYMKKMLKTPAYRHMRLLDVLYGNDQTSQSYQATVTLLDKYPHINGIIAVTPVALDAAAKVLQSDNKVGTVALTGLGFPPDDANLLKSGVVKAYVFDDPNRIGYVTYYAALAVVRGQITGAPGQVFTAGKLGKFTVGPHGDVIAGPAIVFTAKNVASYLASDFQTTWHDVRP